MDDPTDDELRAYFGPRADYYIAQWRGTARRGYNWAAFLFGGLWFPFRRMYRAAAVFWGVAIVVTVGSEFAFRALGHSGSPKWFDRTTALLASFACGVAGNYLYLGHARRLIAATRTLGLTNQEYLAALSSRGGARLSHALICLALLGLLIVAFVAAAIGLAYLGEK